MIHIDPKDAERGSLSSITFADAYGSRSDGGSSNLHTRARTASSDLADADNEEQLRRYQLSKANAANVAGGASGGPALPPRPSRSGVKSSDQTNKRKGHRRRRDEGERHGDHKVQIEFPSEGDGILAPGIKPPSSLIDQGDFNCAYICTCFLLLLIVPLLVYFYTNTSESWRLHAGASRHVVIASPFSKSVTITRTPPTQEHGHEDEVDTGG